MSMSDLPPWIIPAVIAILVGLIVLSIFVGFFFEVTKEEGKTSYRLKFPGVIRKDDAPALPKVNKGKPNHRRNIKAGQAPANKDLPLDEDAA